MPKSPVQRTRSNAPRSTRCTLNGPTFSKHLFTLEADAQQPNLFARLHAAARDLDATVLSQMVLSGNDSNPDSLAREAGVDWPLTWLLEWYDPFNVVRTQFFKERGIFDRMVPASTGIGASNPWGSALIGDAIAVKPKSDRVRVIPVASPLQCPALDYRSSFSRAAEIICPGYRELYVSGTASIHPNGKTAHVGDPAAQIDLTMRVVQAILKSRGVDWGDVTQGIAYFKDMAYVEPYRAYCRAEKIASWLPLPLPGGWLVMSALFVNLSLNMLRQIRSASFQKGGILLAHAGILLMLAGGWIAHLTAEEGILSLVEGDQSSFALAYEDWELAIWDADTLPEKAPYTFPAEALSVGEELTIEELGLVLKVEAYYPNARILEDSPAPDHLPVLNVTGITQIEPHPRRGDPGQYEPGLQVIAEVDGHESQRVIFHGSDPMPLVLSLPDSDSEWYLYLRRSPMPLPVTIQLLEFSKVFEPHTTVPRSFSSRVLVDTDGVQRELVIEMNRPFRYRGFTFFQSSYGETEDGSDISVFAVSHNRVMWAPYIATGLTGVGMLYQFLVHWIKHSRKRRGAKL